MISIQTVPQIRQQRIYLTGMPGSGKSTIGKKLAKLLQWDFVDLDLLITENEGMDIKSIFELKGELSFRKAEQKALHLTGQMNKIVIACGGGTPAFDYNMQWINKNGISIFLDAPLSFLKSRILQSKKERPLFKDLQNEELQKRILKLSEERSSFYRQASLIISLPLKSIAILAEQAFKLI